MAAVRHHKMIRLSRCALFLLCLAAALCIAQAPAHAALKSVVKKKAGKAIAKTALKKYIPVANVFSTAYELTQFAMEGADLYNAANDVIQGIEKEMPWAVSYTQVFMMGWQIDSDLDPTYADCELSVGNWLGDAASSHSEALKHTGRITVTGSSQGWASWLGMAGIGASGNLGGQAIKTLIVRELNQIMDPYNTPIIDTGSQAALEQEVQLLYPSGFDYVVRIYYPTSMPDSVGPLYYEAEVFGYLELADSTAYKLSDAIRPAVYSIADYYNRSGGVTKRLEGADVCNLAADSFVYFEADTARAYYGSRVPTFGYKLEDFDLTFNVNAPAEWSSSGSTQERYIHYDFQVIVGGASEGGGTGPQWGTAPVYLFQDNFPEDESDIESYVRADMAQDINPPGASVHPGDSVVVTCFDLFSSGLAEYAGGPAVFLHVRATYIGPAPPKPNLYGPSLVGDCGLYISDNGSWTTIRGDTARTGETIAENKFMFDLNDSLFTRGYRIDYYFSAMNVDYETSTLPQGAGGGEYFEFTCLPTLNTPILYVDAYHGYGTEAGNVEQYIMPMLNEVLCPPENIPDRYDINDPAALASNSLGSRARLAQLKDAYSTIIWDAGDLSEGTIRDGTWMTDKSPDCQLLVDWMNGSLHDCGLWICGDNVAEELSALASPSALSLLSVWCGVSFVHPSYFDLTGGYEAVGITSPVLTGDSDAGVFVHVTVPRRFYAFGSPPNINGFDVLEKTGTGQYALQYPDYEYTDYYAAIASTSTNSEGYTVRTMWFGCSFQSIRDMEPASPIIRNYLARDVFDWMEYCTQTIISANDVPGANFLGQNFPNPFNPSTKIVFTMKEKGLVTIRIYNVAGQLVRILVDEMKDTGTHSVSWDGTNDAGRAVQSGIYFYEMEAGGYISSKKMVLLK